MARLAKLTLFLHKHTTWSSLVKPAQLALISACHCMFRNFIFCNFSTNLLIFELITFIDYKIKKGEAMVRLQSPPLQDEARLKAYIKWLVSRNDIGLSADDDRYFHWDELRRRPLREGMPDHETWWRVLKISRAAGRQRISLKDASDLAFSFCEPNRVRQLTRKIDLHWGGALGVAGDGRDAGHPDGRGFLIGSLTEEPFSSAFLEGAATTREIAKELILKDRVPKTRDERMVLNNFRALSYVKTRVKDPLSLEFILELHRIVAEGAIDRPERVGVLRQVDDRVFVSDRDDEVLYTPPSAELLPTRLQALCAFANTEEEPNAFIHPVIKAIILHFMIGYEHPFVDGNGRTARALFYWMMLRAGYWLAEYVSISTILKDTPKAYADAYLKTETDEADLTYFILNQCDVIEKADSSLQAYLDRKRRQVDELATLIDQNKRDGGFNHRQTALLNDLLRKRLNRLSISDYQETHGVSYHTARNDLEALKAHGLLSKRRHGRDSAYFPVANLEIKLTGKS